MTESGSNDPLRSFQIDIICSHGGGTMRPRQLHRLHWEENEPWMHQWAEEEDEANNSAVQAILRNERFVSWSHRWNRAGRTTEQGRTVVEFPLDTGAADRAGALGGWRFKCDCGRDVPVRQDKLERWLLDQASRDTQRTVFKLDIAHYR